MGAPPGGLTGDPLRCPVEIGDLAVERDVEGRTARPRAGGPEGLDLCVRFPCSRMEPLTDYLTRGRDEDRADHRIRQRETAPLLGQVEGLAHEALGRRRVGHASATN